MALRLSQELNEDDLMGDNDPDPGFPVPISPRWSRSPGKLFSVNTNDCQRCYFLFIV
jgi:hypothetical protein